MSTTIPTAPTPSVSPQSLFQTILNALSSTTTGPSPRPTDLATIMSPFPATTFFGGSPDPIMQATTTAIKGVFGVDKNFDPFIITGLVLAGLILLVLFGALIYCCCVCCGFHSNRQRSVIRRTASIRSLHLQDPEAFDGYSTMSGVRRVRRVIRQPETISVRTVSRRKYLYPADGMGFADDYTYNTVRPRVVTRSSPMIASLGDGYGRSIRSNAGSTFGRRRRSLVLLDDGDSVLPRSRIIALD